ncbi:MAG TPA: Rieske 2Fe-2S domain-containing protein [Chloroflexia bacterium]|nr:Rieske 2Fe-2S domain-containing protein [Chloroflexia bacterium]
MTIQYRKNGLEPKPNQAEPTPKTSEQSIREQFPISHAADAISTRRSFLKVLGLSSGAFFTGTAALALAGALQGEEKYEPKKIAELGRLKAGQSTTFAYPGAEDPCLLVHLGNDQYVAYSQKCTHLACPVYWEAKNDRLECPCHEGAFNVRTGAVLGGPPPRPLPKINLKVENGSIYAVGVDLNLKAGEA